LSSGCGFDASFFFAALSFCSADFLSNCCLSRLLFSTSYRVDGVFVLGSRLPSGEFGLAGVLKS